MFETVPRNIIDFLHRLHILKQLSATDALMQEFEATADPLVKWNVPFPLAVFGTLRLGQSNHPLMGLPVGQEPPADAHKDDWDYTAQPYSDARYSRVLKACLPNFSALNGIALRAKPGLAVFFEIFVYDAENWAKVMPRIEQLENFNPRYAQSSWYFRTLANLRILPDSYTTPDDLGGVRPDIKPKAWAKLPIMPCWFYSSYRQNQRSLAGKNSPIVWNGDLGIEARN